ncbi:hypothetical protein H0H93_007817 [Arthromyces matolae]|nr:hypothetical protein H0H93_007817 [Arthromyces matolae]
MPDHHPNNLIMKATLHLGLLFTLEGPWYGAYLYVLSHIIFQPLIDKVKTWTYPQYPLTLEVDSGNHDEDPDDMGDPTNIVKDEVPRMRRSTRIPDFAQIQHLFLDDDIIGYRFLMLAENKKHPTPAQLHDPEAVHYLFIKALKQVTQQASHAFRYSPVGARFKEIDTIGAIVGIGSLWTYVKFE